MKTLKHTTSSFPAPFKISLYVCAVVVLCFLNWVALHAEGPTKKLENQLDDALVEEVEAEIEVQEWMLTFSNHLLTSVEPEIELEPWMLTFSNDFIADREPEIEIEPWMLTFSDDYMVVNETELHLEHWMINTFFWETATMLARK